MYSINASLSFSGICSYQEMEAGGTELYTQGCHTLLVGVAESYAFHVVSQTLLLLLTTTGAPYDCQEHLYGLDLQANCFSSFPTLFEHSISTLRTYAEHISFDRRSLISIA